MEQILLHKVNILKIYFSLVKAKIFEIQNLKKLKSYAEERIQLKRTKNEANHSQEV